MGQGQRFVSEAVGSRSQVVTVHGVTFHTLYFTPTNIIVESFPDRIAVYACHHLPCQSAFAVAGCICGEVTAGKALSPYEAIAVIIVHDVYDGSGGSYLVGAQALLSEPVGIVIYIFDILYSM